MTQRTGSHAAAHRQLTDDQRKELRHTSAHRIRSFSDKNKMSTAKKVAIGIGLLIAVGLLAYYGPGLVAKPAAPAAAPAPK